MILFFFLNYCCWFVHLFTIQDSGMSSLNDQYVDLCFLFSCYGSVLSLNGEPEPSVFIEAVGHSLEDCTKFQEESKTEQDGSYRIRGLQVFNPLSEQCLSSLISQILIEVYGKMSVMLTSTPFSRNSSRPPVVAMLPHWPCHPGPSVRNR